jgi:mannose-6-phosphate isomerase-like protein (cupin superfamily)
VLYTTSINQEHKNNFTNLYFTKKGEDDLLRKDESVRKVTKPSPFGGTGNITVRDILESPEDMYQKGRVFCHTTVYPESGIGYHVHKGESETYYIMSGHGTFNDNGVLKEVGPGDVLFTGDQEGHSLEATHGENLEIIALILYH